LESVEKIFPFDLAAIGHPGPHGARDVRRTEVAFADHRAAIRKNPHLAAEATMENLPSMGNLAISLGKSMGKSWGRGGRVGSISLRKKLKPKGFVFGLEATI
jgi:hypothetical protein